MARTHTLPLAGLLVTLIAAPAFAARLSGSVVGDSGTPVHHARIVLEGPTGPVATTHTTAGGTFTVEAPAGDYVLRVVADGFDAPTQLVTLRDEREATARVTLAIAAITEQVVVAAGLVPVTRSGTGAALTVIDEADMRAQQMESTVDALRLVPGMTVSRSGGRGAVTSLFPRGGESDFTLVLVDGIRLNDMGGSHDAAHLPLFDLERIEVVSGPQSAVHGSDAVGGVVQMVTRHGGPLRATLLAEGGTFGTWRGSGSVSGTSGRVRWGGGIERLASDGFTGTAPGTGETVSNDDYARTDATARLGYQGARLEVSGLVRGGRNKRGAPGPYGSDPNGTYAGVDRVSRNDNETIAAGAAATWRVRPDLQVRGAVSVADRDSTFVSVYTPDDPTSSGNRMLSGRAQVDGARSWWSWTAGAEYLRERARSAFITGMRDQEIPVDRSQVGAFGEGRIERGRLSLQAGLRVEQIVRGALEGQPSPFSPRPPFAEDTVRVANPRLSVSWRAIGGEDAWLRLHGNAGTGMRAPGAFEIAFTDNPGLKPERTRSVDAGVEAGWLGGRLVLDALYFHNDYDDLIVTVGRVAGTTTYRSDNISNARTRGAEIRASVRPVAGVTLRAGYVRLATAILGNDGSDAAPEPFRPGDALLRRPTHAGHADVRVTTGRASGFLRVDARGSSRDIDPSFGASSGIFSNPGFVTADAGLSIRATDSLDVFARVTNVFDTRYEEIFGFPALGRAVMAGVRIAASR